MLFPFSFMQAQGPTYDVDALAFFARVTAAGGSLTLTEKTATNQLVLDLKANSLWTPMKAIYPMVGASAAACAQNLKSSSFTGTFTSGWTFASTGATANGVSTSMTTSLIPSANFADEKISFSTYLSSYTIGVSIATTNSRMYEWRANSAISIYASSGVTVTNNSQGMGICNRNNISQIEYKQQSNSTQVVNQIYEGPAVDQFNIGSFTGVLNADGIFKFVHIGTNLTTAQQTALYNSVQAFQTTLSRQV